MGVSLLEVLEHGGYDITTVEDARWFLSKQWEFDELIDEAQHTIDVVEEQESIESEREYQKIFGDNDEEA